MAESDLRGGLYTPGDSSSCPTGAKPVMAVNGANSPSAPGIPQFAFHKECGPPIHGANWKDNGIALIGVLDLLEVGH